MKNIQLPNKVPHMMGNCRVFGANDQLKAEVTASIFYIENWVPNYNDFTVVVPVDAEERQFIDELSYINWVRGMRYEARFKTPVDNEPGDYAIWTVMSIVDWGLGGDV